MITLARSSAAAGLIVALASGLGAQTPAATERFDLRGLVLDSATLAPLNGVSVTIDSSQLRQTTDNAGRFNFPALLPGHYLLRARHLGHREASFGATVASGDTGTVILVLAAVATRLETVQVAGSAVQVPSRFDEPYKRAAAGRGVFFTRKDLDAINAHDYQTLFNRVPGVNANDRGVAFQRCRDSGSLEYASVNKVQVWVDGHRMYGQDPNKNVMEILRLIPPYTIEIMEVYPSQSVIPAAFLGDACAVIALWTKSY